MEPNKLKKGLNRVRILIFLIRAVQQCIIWTAYFAVALFIYLFVFRIFAYRVDWSGVSVGFAVTLFCAVSVAIEKIGSLKSSAIYLDKFFGLDERLSTALEISDRKETGFFDRAVVEDATSIFSALALGKLRQFHAKRETVMLIVAAGLSAMLLLSPGMPNVGESKVDVLKELSQNEALELKVVAAELLRSAGDKNEITQVANEAGEIAKKLIDNNGEFSDKLNSLKALQKKVDELVSKSHANGLSEEQTKLLKGLSREAASAGSSLGNAAEKEGVWTPSQEELYQNVVEKFEESGLAKPITKSSGKFESTQEFIEKSQPTLKPEEQKVIMDKVIKAVDKHNWPEKYDAIIKKYYSQ